MTYLLKGVRLFSNGEKDPVILGKNQTNVEIIEFDDCVAFPAFADVHVHFREPGFSYKETMETGMNAASAGGYTLCGTMPNVNPCPDTKKHLGMQYACMGKNPKLKVVPYGAITKERAGKELSDMDEMKDDVIAFSDDGSGVQNEDVMRAAMKKAKELGKIICAHCEDESLLFGGYIHDGEYAKMHGHRGISSASEYKQIERDLALVRETGCSYHVCHISTKESVDFIRKAKKEGLDVTCETAPHYLVLTDMDLEEDARFKMNPPLRSEEDKKALIEGIIDGTIDMIATDHAPHSLEEKSKGLEKSAMGVVGLETAFSVMYTYLVKPGILTLEKVIELMSINPRKRFGFDMDASDVCVFDLNKSYTVYPERFQSMGESTPFQGHTLYGVCRATFCGGNLIWRAQD